MQSTSKYIVNVVVDMNRFDYIQGVIHVNKNYAHYQYKLYKLYNK